MKITPQYLILHEGLHKFELLHAGSLLAGLRKQEHLLCLIADNDME